MNGQPVCYGHLLKLSYANEMFHSKDPILWEKSFFLYRECMDADADVKVLFNSLDPAIIANLSCGCTRGAVAAFICARKRMYESLQGSVDQDMMNALEALSLK
jgi:hypothetical protein